MHEHTAVTSAEQYACELLSFLAPRALLAAHGHTGAKVQGGSATGATGQGALACWLCLRRPTMPAEGTLQRTQVGCWLRDDVTSGAAWTCQHGPLRLQRLHSAHTTCVLQVIAGHGGARAGCAGQIPRSPGGSGTGRPAAHRVEHDDVDGANIQRVVQLAGRQRLLVRRADARLVRLERAQLLVLLDLRADRERASSSGPHPRCSAAERYTCCVESTSRVHKQTHQTLSVPSFNISSLCSAALG